MEHNQTSIANKPRHAWVDVVRGLGIVLVFYGHYIQQGVDPHNASAVEQFRFIYSFHMPLFFIMSGFFFRPTVEVFSRIGQLALRRLIPVLVFGIFLLPIWLRYEILHSLSFRHDLAHMAFVYLDGRPELNWVTWFLVCLFMCESLAVLVLGRLKGWKAQLPAGVFFLSIGLLFCDYSILPSEGWWYAIGRTWFLSEALVALGFYIIGYAAFPLLKQLSTQRTLAALIFLVTISIVFFTYRFNHPQSIAVMMAARTHGNSLYFVVTALAGAFAMFALAILIQSSRLLEMIGRNTLVLLGLNGLFYTYLDPKLLSFFSPANSPLFVTLDSVVVTVLSLLLCVPIVYFMNRFVPQLIGNINVSGPVLPAFVKH
ncbi:MAG: acyltransferase family protein [Gammaproteobacteria bacterium]|nr:acyltransferase family protein [Gammaproteobacteria bacterium]